MPILIALVAAIGGALFWYYRIRMTADAASDLADMASDVIGAARRFGFRRRAGVHPVESIEDERLAAGALSVAFLNLGARQTDEDRGRHLRAMQSHLQMSKTEAEEVLILGQWLVNECHGASAAVERIGKKLMRLAGSDALDHPLLVVQEVAGEMGGLTDAQRDALHDLKNIFRRR